MAFPPPPRPTASAALFQPPRPASSARFQARRPPRRRASWALRLIYCLALIAPIVPAAVFLGSEWVALNTSASAWSIYRIVAVLLVLARFLFVLVRPRALQAYVAVPLLRFLSIAAMSVGLILAAGSFFAKPLTLWLFGMSDLAGWGYLAVIMVLTHGAHLATLGVLVFELNRAIGGLKAAFARVIERRRLRGR